MRNANSCHARKARRAMEVRSLTTESSIGRASPRVGRTCSEWLLRTAERAEEYLLASGYRFKQSMQLLPEQFSLRQGAWRARLAAHRAWRQVPAYRHFLAVHGLDSPPPAFDELPV